MCILNRPFYLEGLKQTRLGHVKYGVLIKPVSLFKVAKNEDFGKISMQIIKKGILTALPEFDESQTVEDSDLEVVEYEGYSTDSESKQTSYESTGSRSQKLTFMFSIFLPIVMQ